MRLNYNQALQMMERGKTVGLVSISGIEICKLDDLFLFKHKDGKVEKMNSNTIDFDDVFILVEDSNCEMVYRYRSGKFA